MKRPQNPIYPYKRGKRLGRGSYASVYETTHAKTKEVFAIKKFVSDIHDGLETATLREIACLKYCNNHPNLIKILQILALTKDNVAILLPLFTYDLTQYLAAVHSHPKWNDTCIADVLVQILQGLRYLHSNGFLHRDLKPHNILINLEAAPPNQVVIADLGLCVKYVRDTPRPSKKSTNIITLWYRPPEILLGQRRYTTSADLWGVGCILAEMLTNKALLQGDSDIDQVNKIFDLLGTPTEGPLTTLPHPIHTFRQVPSTFNQRFSTFGPHIVDLLSNLLQLDPTKRPDCDTALLHPFCQSSDMAAYYKDKCRDSDSDRNVPLLLPNTDLFENQKHTRPITPTMRNILFDWIIDVSVQFLLHHRTYFRFVELFDRYIKCTPNIDRQKLQLIGVCCLLIAAKLEERSVPTVKDFLHICDNAVTSDEMHLMEFQILKQLDFDIYRNPLVTDFISKHIRDEIFPSLKKLKKYQILFMLYYATFDYKFFNAQTVSSLVADAHALTYSLPLRPPDFAFVCDNNLPLTSLYGIVAIPPQEKLGKLIAFVRLFKKTKCKTVFDSMYSRTPPNTTASSVDSLEPPEPTNSPEPISDKTEKTGCGRCW